MMHGPIHIIYSMLGQTSGSVVVAVRATKKVRIHHFDRPVISSDVRQNTGTLRQYATSTHTHTHTHKHTHRRFGREYVIIHLQLFTGDRIPVGGSEIFRIRRDRPCGPPILLYNGYRVFPGSKAAGGMRLTTHTHLAPRLNKE